MPLKGAIILLPVVPALATGSGTWTLTSSLHTARQPHAAKLLQNGEVLEAFGYGAHDSYTTATAELYNPSTGTWTYTGSLNYGT